MAIIALAHSHALPAFNATFFATVAVIIPVLYLALVVQGGGGDALLREALGVVKALYEFLSDVRRGTIIRLEPAQPTTGQLVALAPLIAFAWLVNVILAVAMAIAAFLIAVAGGVSELCAVYALYKQDAVISIPRNVFGPNSTSINVTYIVLAGTGFLIVATTVLPFAQLLGRVRPGKAEPPAKPSAGDKPPPDEAG